MGSAILCRPMRQGLTILQRLSVKMETMLTQSYQCCHQWMIWTSFEILIGADLLSQLPKDRSHFGFFHPVFLWTNNYFNQPSIISEQFFLFKRNKIYTTIKDWIVKFTLYSDFCPLSSTNVDLNFFSNRISEWRKSWKADFFLESNRHFQFWQYIYR